MNTISYEWKQEVYPLETTKLIDLYQDEQVVLEEITKEQIFEMLAGKIVQVEKEYYDQGCEVCHFKKDGEEKYYGFLEAHFYIFAKEGKLVGNSLAGDYEALSFRQLEKQGKVDQLYLVSFIICMHCGSFSVEIECCD